MDSASDEIKAMYKANLDAAREIAAASLAGTEKALSLPFQMTREMIEKDGDPLSAVVFNNGFAGALTELSDLCQNNAQKVADIAQDYFQMTTMAHSELFSRMQKQMETMHQNFVDSIKGAANAGTEGAGVVAENPKLETRRLAA